MSLLIDGYNLLHASGVMPSGQGPHTLERAREALLRHLAASLTEAERARTTIVFDAREAPYNKPRTLDREGMTIHFAPRDSDADTVIEELLQADHAPKRVTVVSSDHRVQNAARRRRATAVDSGIWWRDLMQNRAAARSAAPPECKPDGKVPPSEVARWMEELQLDSLMESLTEDEIEEPPPTQANYIDTHAPPTPGKIIEDKKKQKRSRTRPSDPNDKILPGHMPNPFPPGYGEDVSEEDV